MSPTGGIAQTLSLMHLVSFLGWLIILASLESQVVTLRAIRFGFQKFSSGFFAPKVTEHPSFGNGSHDRCGCALWGSVRVKVTSDPPMRPTTPHRRDQLAYGHPAAPQSTSDVAHSPARSLALCQPDIRSRVMSRPGARPYIMSSLDADPHTYV